MIKNIAQQTIVVSETTNTQKPMESAAFWTGVLAVGFTALAAVAGSFSWWFLHKLAVRKDAELVQFQQSSNQAIAEAHAESATANARAAEANKIAEQERVERLKLEERLAFRSIDANARAKISAALKVFAPQPYDMIWYPDDKESYSLSNEIFNILNDAGWTFEQSGAWLGLELTEGVIIDLGDERKNDFGPAVQALSEQLSRHNIAVVIQSRPKTDEEADKRIRIRVGKKP